MKKVLVSGGQGFVGSYLCQELLEHGYSVISVDNFSKYGVVSRPQDKHPNFKLYEMDARDLNNRFKKDAEFKNDIQSCDYIVACAALIGGISFFHAFAFDLIAENEEILAATFRLAINLHQNHQLEKIIVLSSSMVYESTSVHPTPEGEQLKCPPPLSTYGFQKLSSEYFCKGAWEQYKLPYSIVRPFNCVGIGEEEALGAEQFSVGNTKMMLSHVLPDLIERALKLSPNDDFEIFGSGEQQRCYTAGSDLARGIRLVIESEKARNNDYNLSFPNATSVADLAQMVWKKIHGTTAILKHLEPFAYDVQMRLPDTTKAKEELGFEAIIPVEQSVEEVLKWIKSRK